MRDARDKEDNVLRRIRKIRQLSQLEASALVCISRPMWSSWECGTRSMSIENLYRLWKGLGLDDQELIDLISWWGVRLKLIADDSSESS